MSKKKQLPTDPDMLGSMQAIKRSANRARQIAEATNTPCYVQKDGKVIDIARKQISSK